MLDDRDFWDDTRKGDAQPTDEQNFDIESILADVHKEMGDTGQSQETASQTSHMDELDDSQVMREMLLAMRELTAEVKQLRFRIEAKPYDPAHYPNERPPGIAAGVETGGAPETKPEAQGEKKKPSKKNRVLSIISSVLFYAVIVAMVLGAFLMRSTSKGSPFMIAGYSAANVLTSSMEDVYPKGSLIITKQVDAKDLQIGDDITFMVSEESSITHRIIEIIEDYQETGERAFKTQGTMNAKPDKDMVAAANVVGKVIFHSKVLGDFANFVKANWPILIFVLIVIIALISFLKWNAKRTDDEEKNLSVETPSPKKGSRMKRRSRESEETVE